MSALEAECDEALSNLAFNLKLRRYPELPTADVMRELVLPRLDGDSSFRPFPMLPKPPAGQCSFTPA
jgi:hypothetical protein